MVTGGVRSSLLPSDVTTPAIKQVIWRKKSEWTFLEGVEITSRRRRALAGRARRSPDRVTRQPSLEMYKGHLHNPKMTWWTRSCRDIEPDPWRPMKEIDLSSADRYFFSLSFSLQFFSRWFAFFWLNFASFFFSSYFKSLSLISFNPSLSLFIFLILRIPFRNLTLSSSDTNKIKSNLINYKQSRNI